MLYVIRYSRTCKSREAVAVGRSRFSDVIRERAREVYNTIYFNAGCIRTVLSYFRLKLHFNIYKCTLQSNVRTMGKYMYNMYILRSF